MAVHRSSDFQIYIGFFLSDGEALCSSRFIRVAGWDGGTVRSRVSHKTSRHKQKPPEWAVQLISVNFAFYTFLYHESLF